MKIRDVLRRALDRMRTPSRPTRARAIDEQRGIDAVRSWERPGGPIDPGVA